LIPQLLKNLLFKNMTAFSPSDIPTNINTLEKLALWLGSALASCNPNTMAIEAPNYSTRVCQVGTFLIEADNKYRSIIRFSIPINSDFLIGVNNPWTYAEELSSNELNPLFKSAS
jgi:hypothetical protein